MREHGVLTISDLKMLDDATALELAEKTSATKSAVEMARRRSRQDGSVEFLESLRCTLVAGQAPKKCPEVRAEPARTLPPVVEGSEDGVVVGVTLSSGRHHGQESVSEREPGSQEGPKPGRPMAPPLRGGER